MKYVLIMVVILAGMGMILSPLLFNKLGLAVPWWGGARLAGYLTLGCGLAMAFRSTGKET